MLALPTGCATRVREQEVLRKRNRLTARTETPSAVEEGGSGNKRGRETLRLSLCDQARLTLVNDAREGVRTRCGCRPTLHVGLEEIKNALGYARDPNARYQEGTLRIASQTLRPSQTPMRAGRTRRTGRWRQAGGQGGQCHRVLAPMRHPRAPELAPRDIVPPDGRFGSRRTGMQNDRGDAPMANSTHPPSPFAAGGIRAGQRGTAECVATMSASPGTPRPRRAPACLRRVEVDIKE